MNSGRIGCELALLAVFCVLTIFLFPAMQGPYSAVNGPVTALQAARAAACLRIAIQSAFRSLSHLLIASLFLSWMSLRDTKLHPAIAPEFITILRC
jgi:hypothetical protein